MDDVKQVDVEKREPEEKVKINREEAAAWQEQHKDELKCYLHYRDTALAEREKDAEDSDGCWWVMRHYYMDYTCPAFEKQDPSLCNDDCPHAIWKWLREKGCDQTVKCPLDQKDFGQQESFKDCSKCPLYQPDSKREWIDKNKKDLPNFEPSERWVRESGAALCKWDVDAGDDWKDFGCVAWKDKDISKCATCDAYKYCHNMEYNQPVESVEREDREELKKIDLTTSFVIHEKKQNESPDLQRVQIRIQMGPTGYTEDFKNEGNANALTSKACFRVQALKSTPQLFAWCKIFYDDKEYMFDNVIEAWSVLKILNNPHVKMHHKVTLMESCVESKGVSNE